MKEVSDWELVARARSGEMKAFEVLVRRYQAPLIGFCRRMVGSTQDAEELAQESFVRVYRALNRLRPDAKFTTLLFGIARNLALNFIRDAGRRGQGSVQSLSRNDMTEKTVVDAGNRPDRAVRLHEIQQLLERAIAALSTEHREMIVLRELHGMDYDAIAEVAKCRIGTVKSRLARAREQLRLQLEHLGGGVL